MPKSEPLQANARQGKNEQRSKVYKTYGERAAEFLTAYGVASASRVASSAGKQARRGGWF